MTKRRVLLFTLMFFVMALLLQAAWESPLRPAVAWLTAPGCRLGWWIATPTYSINSTVWRFDLVAVAVNTLVYSTPCLMVALFLKLTRRPNSQ